MGGRVGRRSFSLVVSYIGVVAIAYFFGAKAGLAVAFENRNVTAVWPPTGIAVAALLVWGFEIWPGIAIGAFLANLANHAGMETSAAITVGNTIAPIVAVYALRRFSSFDNGLARMRDILALFLIGGLGAMTISATLGTSSLLFTGATDHAHLASNWLVWWIGDAIGVILFAPFVILASGLRSSSPIVKRWPQALVVVGVSAALAVLVFNVRVPLVYALLIPVVVAAQWLEQPGAALITVLLALIAVAETVSGHGPFASQTPTENLVALQIFNAVLAVTGLSVAATVRGRRNAEETLRSSEARHRNLFQHASDAIWLHNLDGQITYVNPAVSEVTELPPRRLLAMTMEELAGPEQALVVKRAMDQLIGGQEATTTYRLQINRATLEINAVLVDGAVQVIARDVTSRAIEEGQLRRNALRDPGTGLANRTLLAERIEYALAVSESGGRLVALFDLDIDNFARVNDEHGSGIGDALLRTIAHRLTGIVRPTDTVARIGGDEFAILVSPLEGVDEARAIASRISKEIAVSSPLTPSASIGVAIWDGVTNDVQSLLREADRAMHIAKRNGPDSIEISAPTEQLQDS